MNQQFDISAATEASSRPAGVRQHINRRIVLASRPEAMPSETNFALEVAAFPGPIGRGQVLVRSLYLSMDPYLRGKMRETPAFGPPFEVNEPLSSSGLGEVVESQSPRFKPGDRVFGTLPWADYGLASARELHKVDPKNAPITAALSVLGMTGLTAYFGMLEIAGPRKGDTAVISAAAGAVGSVAGQLARLKGARAVGIVGSDAKARFIQKELGFDGAVNYKNGNFQQTLDRACPEGIDVYYDNVGGTITDQVMTRLRDDARVVICGQISTYNRKEPDLGLRPYSILLAHGAMVKGFSVYDYTKRHKEGLRRLALWVRTGKLTYRENIVEGLENAPKAFIGLFKGENIGKQLVKVS